MFKLFYRNLFTIALSVLIALSPLAAQAAPVRVHSESQFTATECEAFLSLDQRKNPGSTAKITLQSNGIAVSDYKSSLCRNGIFPGCFHSSEETVNSNHSETARTVTPSLKSETRNLAIHSASAPSGRLIRKGKKLRYRLSNGTYLRSRWLTLDGTTYYFAKTTYALTGFQYVGGKVYYFNSSGILQRRSRMLNGKVLKLNKDCSIYSYDGVRYNIPTGKKVAAYACRFVGNPYKWGGTSLTNGADCSGFVKAVYARFNVTLPHYDASIRKCGRSVSGLSSARAGDVICYNGHVAIYLGNNRIVHAANKRQGICISNNTNYMRILSIRRFF